MRLPYVSDPPLTANDEDAAVVERIRRRRGGGLGAVDRILLHAPATADGWNVLIGTLRTGTSLPDSIRELAICRVAALNRAAHEWKWHFPLLHAALPSIRDETVNYIRNAGPCSIPRTVGTVQEKLVQALSESSGLGREQNGIELDERHGATLAYADSITKDIDVPNDVFALVQENFSHQEIVELTATIALYNGVSRFLVALKVGDDEWDGGPLNVNT